MPEVRSAERKPISKRKRFEVFKRDHFTCRYCGRKPPLVVLDIDHALAVSAGGTNDLLNLVASCFDCNRGKAGRSLERAAPGTEEIVTRALEAQKQLRAYRRLLEEEEKRADFIAEQLIWVAACWEPYRPLGDKERESIKKNFVPFFTEEDLADSMGRAFEKCGDRGPQAAWQYFCGIMWSKRREQGLVRRG